ncbi:hypothetical protein GGS20DRAFT_565361 [Poronia punctata]|nr:hypothetical protein GGS20DRAFT_565361 [Poronia punctata]
MKFTTTAALAALASLASAKDDRTFAVLRFDGDQFLTEGPIDPIVSPGQESSHYHTIMGGSNFAATVDGGILIDSECTTAKIKNDKSNYWVPGLFFQDPSTGQFQKVPLYYMNVYYFFEPTDDEIKAFPLGLKMVAGDALTRSPPASGGALNLDPDNGTPINSAQWTCPRQSYDPPSYPTDSDGTMGGQVDPTNQGAGTGFPYQKCDGTYSPLRMDIHFPSCYNPEAGLDDHRNNMRFPSVTNFRENCPEGWIHVPHLFYEIYWNTPLFDDLWTADGTTQPFVLATGDATGYSSHGDFISGWDEETLQTIVDTCNAGTTGMDQCPQIPGGLNDNGNCKIDPVFGSVLPLGEFISELPVVGTNVTGWGKGGNSPSPSYPHHSSSSSSSSTSKYSTATPTEISSTSYKASSTSEISSTYEASSTSEATSSTYKASSTSEGAAKPAATSNGHNKVVVGGPGIKAQAPSSASASAPTDVPSSPPANDASTIYDFVTVTVTATIAPATETETSQPLVHRHAPRHSHGHHHRHLGGSFAARRR